MKEEERSEYIDSLNLEIRTQKDIDKLFIEYEEGRINREEIIALFFLSHSVTGSKSFRKGWDSREKAIKRVA